MCVHLNIRTIRVSTIDYAAYALYRYMQHTTRHTLVLCIRRLLCHHHTEFFCERIYNVHTHRHIHTIRIRFSYSFFLFFTTTIYFFLSCFSNSISSQRTYYVLYIENIFFFIHLISFLFGFFWIISSPCPPPAPPYVSAGDCRK